MLRTKKTDFSIGELNQEVKSRITNLRYEQQAQAFPIVQTGHDGGEFIFRLRKNNDDEKAYHAAKTTNTVAAYSDYLQKHTEYADEVRGLKLNLESAAQEKQNNEKIAREQKAWDLLSLELSIIQDLSQKIQEIQVQINRTFLSQF